LVAVRDQAEEQSRHLLVAQVVVEQTVEAVRLELVDKEMQEALHLLAAVAVVVVEKPLLVKVVVVTTEVAVVRLKVLLLDQVE
jgi:hypothetical protein